MGIDSTEAVKTSTVPERKAKMPKGSGKQVTSQGTNQGGSNYSNYSDGGYRYSNPSGSSYYNTGNGHGFYNSGSQGTKSSGGTPYTTHYNYNQGTSSTNYKGGKQ